MCYKARRGVAFFTHSRSSSSITHHHPSHNTHVSDRVLPYTIHLDQTHSRCPVQDVNRHTARVSQKKYWTHFQSRILKEEKGLLKSSNLVEAIYYRYACYIKHSHMYEESSFPLRELSAAGRGGAVISWLIHPPIHSIHPSMHLTSI